MVGIPATNMCNNPLARLHNIRKVKWCVYRCFKEVQRPRINYFRLFHFSWTKYKKMFCNDSLETDLCFINKIINCSGISKGIREITNNSVVNVFFYLIISQTVFVISAFCKSNILHVLIFSWALFFQKTRKAECLLRNPI